MDMDMKVAKFIELLNKNKKSEEVLELASEIKRKINKIKKAYDNIKDNELRVTKEFANNVVQGMKELSDKIGEKFKNCKVCNEKEAKGFLEARDFQISNYNKKMEMEKYSEEGSAKEKQYYKEIETLEKNAEKYVDECVEFIKNSKGKEVSNNLKLKFNFGHIFIVLQSISVPNSYAYIAGAYETAIDGYINSFHYKIKKIEEDQKDSVKVLDEIDMKMQKLTKLMTEKANKLSEDTKNKVENIAKDCKESIKKYQKNKDLYATGFLQLEGFKKFYEYIIKINVKELELSCSEVMSIYQELISNLGSSADITNKEEMKDIIISYVMVINSLHEIVEAERKQSLKRSKTISEGPKKKKWFSFSNIFGKKRK